MNNELPKRLSLAFAALLTSAAWGADPLPPDTTYRPLPTQPLPTSNRDSATTQFLKICSKSA